MNEPENSPLESMSQQDGIQPQAGTPEASPKKSKRVWIIIAAAAVLFVLVGYIAYWDANLSPKAKMERETERAIQEYQRFVSDFEAAMKNDTYGGATPQETLDMFIAALKAGDTDLASKYFALETDEKSPDYLTRKKWEDGLQRTKQSGKIPEVIAMLEKVEPAGSLMEGYFGFEVRSENGTLIADINMQLNKYSKVWKIEGM
jgi:hypothetical protein